MSSYLDLLLILDFFLARLATLPYGLDLNVTIIISYLTDFYVNCFGLIFCQLYIRLIKVGSYHADGGPAGGAGHNE